MTLLNDYAACSGVRCVADTADGYRIRPTRDCPQAEECARYREYLRRMEIGGAFWVQIDPPKYAAECPYFVAANP